VTGKPLYTGGDVWFVDSVTGTDAASPRGKDRQAPLATLAQAQTNAAAGDIIVLFSTHSETFTAALTISKALTIVGEGSSGGKPTAKFTMNAAGAETLVLTAAKTSLRNILFPEASQTNTVASGGKVNVQATATIDGCYFEQGAKDQLAAIFSNTAAATDFHSFTNCTVISTATLIATRSPYGIRYITASPSKVTIDGLILSDGTVGFSTAAWDSTAIAITLLQGENISLLLGADMLLHSATGGHLVPATVTGGGRVLW
jgi:hypothetical protein